MGQQHEWAEGGAGIAIQSLIMEFFFPSLFMQIFDYPTVSSITTLVLAKLAAVRPPPAPDRPAIRAKARPIPTPTAAADHPSEDQSSLMAAYAAAHEGVSSSGTQRAFGAGGSGMPRTPQWSALAGGSPQGKRPMVAIAATIFRPLMAEAAGGPLTAASGSFSNGDLPIGDSIMHIPLKRWDRDPFNTPGKAHSNSNLTQGAQFGAFLSSVEAFDASAFGLPVQEAICMDPQHRLLLECASELWLPHRNNAAVSGHRGSAGRADPGGAPVGVYVGISWTEYHRLAEAHQGLEGIGAGAGPYAAQGAVLRCALGQSPYR